ncbi:MAG: DUF4350 domain-containing protein, partial [Bacteroidota bacterium]
VYLEANSDDAFGAEAFYTQLPHLFPEAEIKTVTTPPLEELAFRRHEQTLYIFATPEIEPPGYEIEELLAFVEAGNTLLMASEWAPALWKASGLEMGYIEIEDSISFYLEPDGPILSWRYDHLGPGLEVDTSDVWELLVGTDTGQVAWKATWGAGEIIISTVPLAFSNYYLIRPEGQQLIEALVPQKAFKHVLWDEWYKPRLQARRAPAAGDNNEYALLDFLWEQPAFRWGLGIFLLTGLLYLLFASRRKQRAVPPDDPDLRWMEPYLDVLARMQTRKTGRPWAINWVEQLWLDWQQRYHIRVAPSSPVFAEQLAANWNQPVDQVEQLMQDLHTLIQQPRITDKAVMHLYRRIQNLESSATQAYPSHD